MNKIIKNVFSIFIAVMMSLIIMPIQVKAAAVTCTITIAALNDGASLSDPSSNTFTITEADHETAEFYLGQDSDYSSQVTAATKSFSYTTANEQISVCFTKAPSAGYRYVVKKGQNYCQVQQNNMDPSLYTANVGDINADSMIEVGITKVKELSITLETDNSSASLSNPVSNKYLLTDSGKTANIMILDENNDVQKVGGTTFTYQTIRTNPSVSIAFETAAPAGYNYVIKAGDASFTAQSRNINIGGTDKTLYVADVVVNPSGSTIIKVGIAETIQLTIDADSGVIENSGSASTGTILTFKDSSSNKIADLSIKGSQNNLYAPIRTFEVNGLVRFMFRNVAAGYASFVTIDGTSYLASYDDYDNCYFCDINVTKSSTASVKFVKGFTVTLPAEYNASYLTNYGTVEYSSAEDGTYLPISQATIETKTEMMNFQTGEQLTFYNYTFQDESTRYIKAVLPAANPLGLTAIEALGPSMGVEMVENGTLDNGEVKKLLASGNIQYDNWYTISWSYDEASKLSPEYEVFKHGKIIITAINGDPDFKDKYGQPAIQSDGSGKTGLAMLQPNSKVTIKFVPDAGYQFAGFEINGQPITEGIYVEDDLFTYTFDIHNQLHFIGNFTEGTDIVTNKAAEVASVSLENGSNSVGSGNAQLSVEDTQAADSIKIQMQTAAGADATIQTILGMTLNQYIAKGTVVTKDNLSSKTAWIIQKTELDEEVTVSVVLDEGVIPDGAAVQVIRSHNGVSEAIACTYDAATRTLKFKTNKFSDYAIATTAAATTTTTTTPQETADSSTPNTGSGSEMSFYGFLLLCSLAAAGYSCIKINKYN